MYFELYNLENIYILNIFMQFEMNVFIL